MKHNLQVFIILALCATGAMAQQNIIEPLTGQDGGGPKAHVIQLQGVEWIVPELILGGEWTSSIRLTNQGSAPISKTNVYFVDNNGKPMRTTFRTSAGNVITDYGFSFSLAVGGIIEGVFEGGSSSQFGQAIIDCSTCGTPSDVYGEVQLTNRNPTRPDFQAVFPFEMPATTQYMLFDGRAGFTTTLYVDNDRTTTSDITMEVHDTNNNILRTVNLSLPAIGSGIYTLSRALARDHRHPGDARLSQRVHCDRHRPAGQSLE
jgi:hypothetical protein